jgi:hypothetical protein
MHQGWPKLVQNLWHATPDGGIAALVYGPSEVSFMAAGQVPVRIVEETHYPFEETIRFRVTPQTPVAFPMRLRVPAWAAAARVRINDEAWNDAPVNRLLTLKRTWKEGDVVTLDFTAEVRTSRWVENSVAIERGPLVYGLRIDEDWRHVKSPDQYGDFYEVHPNSPWNYGLIESAVKVPVNGFKLVRRANDEAYPWTLEGAPMELRTQGKRIPEWQLYNHRAGPLPHSRPSQHLQGAQPEEIVLVPDGSTRWRSTEFPVVT